MQADDACVMDGKQLYWPGSCITYDVQQGGSKWATYDETKAAADAAFGAWQVATASCAGAASPTFELQNLGPVACDRHEYNDENHTFGGNANIVVFHDGEWPEADQAGPGLIALTTVSFEVSSGQIFDADIEINGQNQISTTPSVLATAYDLQSILTHEAGHFFGLAHATKACSAAGGDCPTMTRQYPRGSDVFRTLEPDDIAGICDIYGPNRTVSDTACVPRHGFSSTCGTTDKPGGCCAVAPGARSRPRAEALFAGLVGLAVLLLRRRRG
jgi:MYXO-CTERM domain-containing protein